MRCVEVGKMLHFDLIVQDVMMYCHYVTAQLLYVVLGWLVVAVD